MTNPLSPPSVLPADPSWWFADDLKQEGGQPASPSLNGEVTVERSTNLSKASDAIAGLFNIAGDGVCASALESKMHYAVTARARGVILQ